MGAITDLAVGKPGSDRESQRGYDDAVRRERASSPHEELARLAILCRLTEDPEEAQRYADEAWQVACAAGWAQNGTAQQ